MREKLQPKTIRIQFDLTPEQHANLEELTGVTQSPTKKDFFVNAITLLGWAVKERQAGRKIMSVDEGTGAQKELVMPILERADIRPKN